MTQPQRISKTTQNTQFSTLNGIIFGVFMLFLVTTPWIIGGNYPFVKTAILVGLGAILAIGGFFGSIGVSWKNALLWVAVLFFGYVLAQLLQSTSPSLKLAELGISEGPHTTNLAETRARAMELVIPFLAFVLGVGLLIEPRRIEKFFGIVLGLGAAISFFGIAQRLAWNGRVYWFYELLQGGLPFGPFVNRNNAGGFLLICLASVFFFFAKSAMIVEREKAFHSFFPTKNLGSVRRIASWFGQRFASLDTASMYVLIGSVIIILGILASLSRGAVVGLVASGMLGLLLVARVRFVAIGFGLLVVVLASLVAVWSEQFDAIQIRVDSLVDIQEAAEPRFAHWKTALPYVMENWVWGSGLGSYRLMYPPFQTETVFMRWFQHAENQYLEALAECGITGLICYLLIFAVGIYWSVQLLRQKNSSSVAAGIAGIVAISGQILTSLFDFGLFQPANNMLFAAVLAALYGQKNYVLRLAKLKNPSSARSPLKSLATSLLAMSFGVSGLLAGYGYSSVDCREMANRLILAFKPMHKASTKDLDQADTLLTYALKRRPNDAFVHYDLGRLHVLRYRMDEFKKTYEVYLANDALKTDQLSPEAQNQARLNRLFGTDEPLIDPTKEVWQVVTIANLHRDVRFLLKTNPVELERLRSLPEMSELKLAANCFSQAIECCPRLARFYFSLAELAVLSGLSPEKETELAEKAISLGPTDPELLFNAGLLFHNANQPQRAAVLWKKCLGYSRKYDEPIVTICRNEMPMRVFFEGVLPQDPDYLLWLVQKYFSRPEDLIPRKFLLTHIEQIAKKLDKQDGSNYYWMGEINRHLGNLEPAIENLQKAVAINPEKFRWRLSLVYALRDQQRWDEARDHLAQCKLMTAANQEQVNLLLKQIRRAKSIELTKGQQ